MTVLLRVGICVHTHVKPEEGTGSSELELQRVMWSNVGSKT